MAIYRQCTLFILFVFTIGKPYAQEPAFTAYKRLITQADGLPDRNVLCGVQDKYGFLWLGTRSGLCRYDGNKFIFLTKKSHGLRGISVFSLVADDNQGIIITYTLPGVSVYLDTIRDVVNINTLEVKPLSSYYPAMPFAEKDIDRITYTGKEYIRFYTKNAPTCWTYAAATGFRKKTIKGKPVSAMLPGMEKLSGKESDDINTRLNRDIVLEEDGMINMFNRGYIIARLEKGYLVLYPEVMQQKKNIAYFLNFNGQLLPADSAGTAERSFNSYSIYSWLSNYYYDLFSMPAAEGRESVILELEDRKVILYIPAIGYITLFQQEESIHVNAYFKDQQGAFWLCTNVGLYKLTVKKNNFQRHFTRDQAKYSFNNSARGIYVDGDLMCSNLYDAFVYQNKDDTLLMLPLEQNFAITRLNQVLWLGSWYLRKFDLSTRQLQMAVPSNNGEIWSILPLSATRLLLGCTNGLDIYDIAANTITPVAFNGFAKAKLVYKIFLTAAGEVMAVADNGLYIISNEGVVTDCYSADASDSSRKLPCQAVYDVLEDRDGVYWIASNLEGLFKWDRVHHTFRQFGLENGLLSTVICGILEDDYNNLWLGTDYGLVKFNKKACVAKTYTEQDGISDNEFNRSSTFRDATGRLYFGGMNGVTSFHPADFGQENPIQNYPFPLIDFYCFNVTTGTLENRTDEITAQNKFVLYEQNKLFTLSFSLLDYEDREHRYAYKLEGLDNDWTYISENHIRMGNLPYGSYNLRIKAQLADGNWNEQEINVALQVVPPFYKTWWFITASLLCTVLLIIMVFKMRVRMLRAKNEKLEMIINKRTGELNIALNEQKAMLQEIHHRVKNNLQFIQAMIDMQISATKNVSDQRILMDTTRRINAMTLVHEMLYNRDTLESISIKDYIHELADKLHNIVNDRQAPVRFEITIEDVYFNINNCLALGMITTEVLSNSIKHAFRQTQYPVITIGLTRDTDKKNIIYTIQDNGTGFNENSLETGLGMRLIDIFSRQLKGTYTIKNQKGVLFIFTFKWPAG